MEYYKSFNEEALELSKSLPEEQSELYKRHFVPIALDKFAAKLEEGDGGLEEEAILKDLSQAALVNLNLRFDALFGSTRHLINNQKFLEVVPAKEMTEERITGKMYRSKEDKMVAFIHAHARRIIFIDVPDGVTAELNLLFVNTDIPFSTQVIVKTGRESKLNLFEWYSSRTSGESLLSILHEIKVGTYAKADVSMVHNEDVNTAVINFSKSMVADNGILNANYIYNGGSNTRAKNDIASSGFAARSNVIELVMGSAKQKFDLNTIVSNLAKDTVSDLESKASAADSSACILKGFAVVGEDASGSRSFINERGMLLSKNAYISSIPGMSINNANVKATHSSATAPVDEEALFYLTSRGATDAVAKRLIISGFFSSSIAKIENPMVKATVSSLMQEKINNKKFGTIPKLDISNVWVNESYKDTFQGHYKYRELK
ncbi:MAG: SufD family Fe-S cluster assembly protein [Candidatus Micrarchaeales archaeon]|nr:SufD family Fe-S cluster assembly protein [Candidatus Micrarchaeales archaeon]